MGPGEKWPLVTVPPNPGTSTVSYVYALSVSYGNGHTEKGANTVTISQTPAPATTYVALGDSYAAGEGNPGNREVLGQPRRQAIRNPQRLRSFDTGVPRARKQMASQKTAPSHR